VLLEDVLQQTFVARAQQHHVVRHVGVLLVGAEVPDKQAHGVAALVNALVGPVAAVFRRDQVAVGPGRVGVGDHDVSSHELAAGQRHARGASVHHLDAPHFCAAA